MRSTTVNAVPVTERIPLAYGAQVVDTSHATQIMFSLLSTVISVGLISGALTTAAIAGIGTFIVPTIAAAAGGTITVAVASGIGGACLLPLVPIYSIAGGLCGLLIGSIEQCKGNNAFANAICDSLMVVVQAIKYISGLLLAPMTGAIIMGLPIIPVAICFAVGLLATLAAIVVTAGILLGLGYLLNGCSIPSIIPSEHVEEIMGSISPGFGRN